MNALCEFVFLEKSMLGGQVMAKTEGDYRAHDIYSKRLTKGKFNPLAPELYFFLILAHPVYKM